MKNINRIIKEEYIKFLKENYDDDDYAYDYFEQEDEIKQNIFHDFLNNNNPTFTKHVPWKVIPFPRLKKIWEDYIRYGIVRDTKGLNMIANIMINNTIKINVFTTLAGHTPSNPEYDFNENIGYWVNGQINCLFNKPFDKNQLEIPFDNPKWGYKEPEDKSPCDTTVHPYAQEFFNENYQEGMSVEEFRKLFHEKMMNNFFDYYMEDPEHKMGGFMSDYGLTPLLTLVGQLYRETEPEKELVIIDKMLNVVHQRSDIANWFVQGGSRALSQLSGYQGGEEDSAISGSYHMSNY